jgi:aspartate/methionine/tyrosine aminotransferase
MRERTVKISSAGKIFSLTGWKVGFVMAAPPLMRVLSKAHQFLTFTTPPNLQVAAAHGLAKDDAYFAGLSGELAARRDLLTAGLQALGFETLPVMGSYFVTADIRSIGFTGDDVAFCRAITEEAKVTAIPVTAFYAGANPPNHYARFAFCKNAAVLEEALARLGAWMAARGTGAAARAASA